MSAEKSKGLENEAKLSLNYHQIGSLFLLLRASLSLLSAFQQGVEPRKIIIQKVQLTVIVVSGGPVVVVVAALVV